MSLDQYLVTGYLLKKLRYFRVTMLNTLTVSVPLISQDPTLES